MRLGSKQLRVSKPTAEEQSRIRRRGIYLVLDNVLDTYNVGAIFRLADAVAAAEVALCGGTEYPPNTRLHKSAVGTEEWVRWRYFASATEAIKSLRSEIEGIWVTAIEQDKGAVGLKEMRTALPVAVVVGHETNGVDREALDMCDEIVEIPMWGINRSLNVVVATGIVVYKIVERAELE